MVANKRENNFRDLVLCSDPYNIKSDFTEQSNIGYVKCTRSACDTCSNFEDETTFIKSHATGRKFFIRRESSCSTKYVIYVAYCTNCNKQGVGSTVAWKTRLSNYKSHIRKNVSSCKIVKHFLDESVSNLRFVIVDVINNTENLSKT